MAAGIGSLLDVSRRALFVQTQSIRVIGSNIANVNTPGYSRREAELVSNSSFGSTDANSVGTGVEISQIARKVDSFINQTYLSRISDRAKADVRADLLGRAEQQFSLADPEGTIGAKLSQFFSTLDNLALNPSDLALRDAVINAGNELTQSIRTTAEVLATIQREADSRIGAQITEVNRLTSEIATLNRNLAGTELGLQENLTLRDQRDQRIRDLSELITVNSLEMDDGTVNISLDNGFNLVTGSTSRSLDFVTDPSFEPVAGYPVGLDGYSLGHIAFNYGTDLARADVKLTDVIAAGSGQIAGLLSVRGVQADTDTTPFNATGDIVDLAIRVEFIADELLTNYNTEYKGPDESPVGSPGVRNTSSGDLAGNTPGTYSLFTATGLVDSNANGVADDLLVQTYSRIIQFAITNPRDIAAARDLDPVEGSTSFASGDAANIQALAARRNTLVTYGVAGTTTIEGIYNGIVARTGGLSGSAKRTATIAAEQEAQMKELQASVSGVSLDEEFAKLVSFQRAFEASARMIKIGDELLQEIVGLLG